MENLTEAREDFFENEYIQLRIEDGISIGIYKGGYQLTLEIAKKIVEARVKLYNGISYPAYADVRMLQGVDVDARKFLASEQASELIIAGAVIVDSSVISWLGNVYMLLDKPKFPAKLFNSEEDAKKWLMNFME